MPGARDLSPTPGNSVAGNESQFCKCSARCDGVMEWVKAAGQRLHTLYNSFHISFPEDETIKSKWFFFTGAH